MKYLFAAIDARAGRVKPVGSKGAGRPKYNPIQLKKLIVDASEGLDEKTNTHDFVDTLERIVNEIKNTTEHSGPFLQKVRKSDVPDYYDVIKKPMDLATLLKRVKQQTYRTKKAFAEDLDQIWVNALLYNSYPDHPIRRSAEFLRSKSNQLLEFISDPSLPTRSILASAVNESVARSKAGTPAAGAEDDDGEGDDSDEEDGLHRIGRSRLGSFVNGRGRESVSPHPDAAGAANGRHRRETRSPSPIAELAFEERPAIVRTAQAMADFDQFDAELSKLDYQLDLPSLRAASSSRLAPFDLPPPPPTTNGVAPALAATSTEHSQPTAHPSRLTLLMRALQPAPQPSPTPFTTPGSTPAPTAPPEPSAHQEPIAEDEPPDSLWWATVGNAAGGHGTADGTFVGALGAGLPRVPFVSTRLVEPPSTSSKHSKGKKKAPAKVEPVAPTRSTRRNKAASPAKSKPNGVVKPTEESRPKKKAKKSAGIGKVMLDNFKTQQRVKLLEARSRRERSSTAALALDSEDDEAVEDPEAVKPSAYFPPRVPRAMLDSHQASVHSQQTMRLVTHRTLGHEGFDGVSGMALDVLTHVASDYISNLGRTLKLYMDQFGDKLSPEHILLHALGQNGVARPGQLREWVEEQQERGQKLHAIEKTLERRRERAFEAAADVVGEDEDALLDHDAEAIASGALGAKLGEDFFGLASTGLGRELGTSALDIPTFLWRGEARPDLASALDSSATAEFIAPPPYVPLTAEAIPAQIGLLQPYFTLRQQQPVPFAEDGETLGLTEDADALAAQVAAAQADAAAGLEPKGKMPTRAKVPVLTGRIPVKVKREEKEGGSKKKRKKDGADEPMVVE